MDFNNYSNIVDDRARELERSRVMPFLMRKVYTWMALALTITAIVAYGIGNSPGLLMSLFGSKMPMLVLFAAEIGLVIWLSARLSRISITTATVGFIAFSILNGMTMSVFFAVYTTASIALTFFVSAGMFGAMALIGYTTKKNLSSIGGFLIMALIGLIIAGLVNMFLRSTMFDLIISGLGVILFCGLTAWDMQWIKRALQDAPDMGEASQKIALLGALNLYLDFINLFLYLLRFLGDRRN